VDVRRHKLALPVLIPFPGSSSSIAVLPLPESVIRRAHSDASCLFAARDALPDGHEFVVEVQNQILARALSLSVDDLRAVITEYETAALFESWRSATELGSETEAEMCTWLRKRVNDDWEVHHDGAAAFAAEEGPSAFYGRPLADLTRGQLLYYWLARGAFSEWFGPNVTKKPTRQWLLSG
jgi:hypothetical protein